MQESVSCRCLPSFLSVEKWLMIGARLQPNGLRILSQLPGLFERIPAISIRRLNLLSSIPGYEEELADIDISPKLEESLGFPIMRPVVRTEFHR